MLKISKEPPVSIQPTTTNLPNPAGIWISLSRRLEDGKYTFLIEPDLLEWEMPKDAIFHVFLPENSLQIPHHSSFPQGEPPLIQLYPGGLVIFSHGCVVYMDGEELWNWPESGVTYDPHLFFTEKELEDIRRKKKSQDK